jgi:hypothetical protein
MFDVADIWAKRTGHTVRLVSANDHVHARRSMHYAGLAIDLHSSAPDALAALMRRVGYRVLWRVAGHFNHVHVEVSDGPPIAGISPIGPAEREVPAH